MIRPDLNKSSWQHVSFWATKELWLPEVVPQSNWLIFSFFQVNFANLEKVEVLGLPGVEGVLRVRGDKTVTTTTTTTTRLSLAQQSPNHI